MTDTKIAERVEHYMAMPYTKVVKRDTDGDYVAVVFELDGCITHASTEAEALSRLEEAQRAWIFAAVEAGQQIPVAFYVDHPIDTFGMKMTPVLTDPIHGESNLAPTTGPVASHNDKEFAAFSAGRAYVMTVDDDDRRAAKPYWSMLPARLDYSLEAYSTWLKEGRPYPLQNKRKRYVKNPWKPIISGPHDGTHVLLYAEEDHLKIWGKGYFFKGNEGDGAWIANVIYTVPSSNRAGSFAPQYWMPMLQEPVKKETPRG